MNSFFLISIIILSFFVLLALSVSPRITWSNSLIAKDYLLFLTVNKSHYGTVSDEFMIRMTLYGREIVWIVVIIMFFVFGGWLGKKIAVIIGISILVLTFLVPIIKNLVERPRPLVPKVDFLLATDKEYAFPSGHATIVSAGWSSICRSCSCMHLKSVCWRSLSNRCIRWDSPRSRCILYFYWLN